MAPTNKRITQKNQRKKSCWSEYLSRKLSGRAKDVKLSTVVKEAGDAWREMGEAERAEYAPDNAPPSEDEQVEALRATLLRTARSLMERGVGVTGVMLDKHQSVVTFGMPGLVDARMIDLVQVQGAPPSGGELFPGEASGRKWEDRLSQLREDVRHGLNALWREHKPLTVSGTTFSYKLLASGGVAVLGGSPNLHKGLKSCGRVELEGLRERLQNRQVSLQFTLPLSLPNQPSPEPPHAHSPHSPPDARLEPPDVKLEPPDVKREIPDDSYHEF